MFLRNILFTSVYDHTGTCRVDVFTYSCPHFEGDEFDFSIRLGEWQMFSWYMYPGPCSLTYPLPSSEEGISESTGNPEATAQTKSVCVCARTCVYCMCEHVFVYCMCVMPPSALQPTEVKPLHSTTAKGALVMPRPSQAQQVSKHPHEQFLPLHQQKCTLPPLPPHPLPPPPPPPPPRPSSGKATPSAYPWWM